MEDSEYIIALRSKVIQSRDLDCEGELGHMVREYVLQLPNGSSCRGFLCNDAYRHLPEEDHQSQIEELWKLAQSIYGRAQSSP